MGTEAVSVAVLKPRDGESNPGQDDSIFLKLGWTSGPPRSNGYQVIETRR